MSYSTGARPPGRGARTPARLRAIGQHGVTMTATALTVLLAASVLAALAVLATGSVDRGAAQRLAADPDAVVQVSGSLTPGSTGFDSDDRAVRAAVGSSFSPFPAQIATGLYGIDLAEVQGARSGTPAAQAQLHGIAVQGLAAHARLLQGAWPAGAAAPSLADVTGQGPVAAHDPDGTGAVADAALPQVLAQQLGARVGDTVRVTDNAGHTTPLRITGIWTPSGNPGYWSGIVGSAAGIGAGGSLGSGASAGSTAVGETSSLVVLSPQALAHSTALGAQLLAVWSALPALGPHQNTSAGELDGLRQRIAQFAAGDTGLSIYHGGTPAHLTGVTVTSSLPQAVDALAEPVVVARSALYQPVVLLAVLACTALILSARHFATGRQAELVLRQLRGAGIRRLLVESAAEWALVALPAAAVGLLLARPLLSLAHAFGAMVPNGGSDGAAAWSAVVLAVAVHGAATLLPVAATVFGGELFSRLRLRGARSAAAQRIGADLALLAVAVLGYLELRHYRPGSIASGAGGVTDVDPVLVLVPAVCALAVPVLVLRLLPLTALVLDRVGARARGLVLPLATWQVSRRSGRNAGPVVLMCLAVAIGALTGTALAGNHQLIADQGAFDVGAQVAVTPAQAAGVDPAANGPALRALPGVTGVSPLTAATVGDGDGGGNDATLYGVDSTGTAAGPTATPLLRAGTGQPAALTRGLAALKPAATGGLLLAGRPTSITLDFNLRADDDAPAPRLILDLRDATGLTTAFTVALPKPDGRDHRVTVPLGVAAAPGLPHPTRSYPLTLTGLDLDVSNAEKPTYYWLTVPSLTAGGHVYDNPPAGQRWYDLNSLLNPDSASDCSSGDPFDAGLYGDDGDPDYFPGAVVCRVSVGHGLLDVKASTGPNYGSGARPLELLLADDGAAPRLPVLADQAAVQQTGHGLSEEVPITLGDGTVFTGRIVGVLPALPGLDRDTAGFMADQRTLDAVLAALEEAPAVPASWWLDSTDPAATAAAVTAHPALGTAATAASAAAQLRADPFRAGLRSVLELCRLLAPLFALIGFAVHAVAAVRERRREFALLRAYGVRSRMLAAGLWAEQAAVTVLSMVPGVLLGAGLAAVILPITTIADDGGRPYPPLRLQVPWAQAWLVAAGTAAVIWLAVSVGSRLLARVDLVRVLRAGEDG